MTYEPVNPEEVGNRRRLILGKHSGTAIVKVRLEEMGLDASQEQICDIVRAIKRAGEDHGRVSDFEFFKLVEDVLGKKEDAPKPG
jgi:isopropylmalate/homocitrate/citramalate synthase